MATYIFKNAIKPKLLVNKGYTYLPNGLIQLFEEGNDTALLSMEYKGKYENKVKIKNELIVDDLLDKNIVNTEIMTELIMNNCLFDAKGNLRSSIKTIINNDSRSIKIYPFMVEEFIKYQQKHGTDISGSVLEKAMIQSMTPEFIEVQKYKGSALGKTTKQIKKTSEEKRFGALLQDNYVDYDAVEELLPIAYEVMMFSMKPNEYLKDTRIKAGYYWGHPGRMLKFSTDNGVIEYQYLTPDEVKHYTNLD